MRQTSFDEYLAFRSDPANDDVSDGAWCAQRNEQILELRARLADGTWAKDVLRARRGRYCAQLIEVDKALFEKAKSGDARAIELLWSRFEQWSPKQADKAPTTARTFAELVSDLRKDGAT